MTWFVTACFILVLGHQTLGKPACKSYPCLIFEDSFDNLNFGNWQHEITAGGGGNWEFQYYDNNRSNSYTRDGHLYIKPTLTSDRYSEQFLTSGTLDLWGASPANLCTGNAWHGCFRVGTGANLINPIQSARLRSVHGFSFRYGKLEVRARMPTGDWLWPAIWLLPDNNEYGGWPASGEIDLVESRGNRQLRDPNSGKSVGVDSMGSTLHWGPEWAFNQYPRTHASTTGGTYGSEFHTYTMDWNENDMTFYVDGKQLLKVDPGDGGFWKFGEFEKIKGLHNPWSGSKNKMAPFDKNFHLILNVAVGGTAFFPDHLQNGGYPKPWSDRSASAMREFWSAKHLWYPTWNPTIRDGEDAAMIVDYVKVWKMKDN